MPAMLYPLICFLIKFFFTFGATYLIIISLPRVSLQLSPGYPYSIYTTYYIYIITIKTFKYWIRVTGGDWGDWGYLYVS
jgi:hypothetical protein